MSGVWMRHPELPPEQLIEVDEASVPHHRSAGWTVTEPPPAPATKTDPEAPADAGAFVSEPAPQTPARRRAPKEAEQQ